MLFNPSSAGDSRTPTLPAPTSHSIFPGVGSVTRVLLSDRGRPTFEEGTSRIQGPSLTGSHSVSARDRWCFRVVVTILSPAGDKDD